MDLVNGLKASLLPAPTPLSVSGIPMVMPVTYSWDTAECSGFLLQVDLYIQMQRWRRLAVGMRDSTQIYALLWHSTMTPLGWSLFYNEPVSQCLATCQPPITAPQPATRTHANRLLTAFTHGKTSTPYICIMFILLQQQPQYLCDAKRLNPRQARWALFLTRFNFKITYRPGTKNTKANALSRQFSANSPAEPESIIPPNVIISPIVWDLEDDIRHATLQEPPLPGCPEGKLITISNEPFVDIRGLGCSPIPPRGPNLVVNPSRYIGPFKILRAINDVAFQLQLPPRYRIHPTFHVSFLKLFSPSATDTTGAGAEPSPPEVLDQPSIYLVHEILDSQHRGGCLEYLVDWEGYGPEELSWVARDVILDPALLLDFHRSHPDRPAPHGRGRPRRRVRVSGATPGGGGNVRYLPQPPPLSTSQHTRSLSPEY
ncbi:hypothetical protein M9458_009000 [Cirrhinus mrigala]|uniref:Chromo domain-containing protein n=1 Tax=Cirrhinus mrigala TaxID=683832 RepID=A0ABD0RA62_CIRMR